MGLRAKIILIVTKFSGTTGGTASNSGGGELALWHFQEDPLKTGVLLFIFVFSFRLFLPFLILRSRVISSLIEFCYLCLFVLIAGQVFQTRQSLFCRALSQTLAHGKLSVVTAFAYGVHSVVKD